VSGPCDAAEVQPQFSVRVTVRSYEIDSLGHVNHAVYHQYGEHARSEHLLAAGYTMAAQRTSGTGVVMLESRIRYLHELTFGEEVEVTSDLEFGTGKAFRIEHAILRADGGRAAEISCVFGLFDTAARRLLPEPRARLTELLDRPELIGVEPA
jgi:acyl-CoA thioester hydrolase